MASVKSLQVILGEKSFKMMGGWENEANRKW